MKSIGCCFDFLICSAKFRFWELLSSIAVIFLFGAAIYFYWTKSSIYLEHLENQRVTETTINALDPVAVKNYEDLLSWFRSSKESIPSDAVNFVNEVTEEAQKIVQRLNEEMKWVNDVQDKAIQREKGGRYKIEPNAWVRAIENSYEQYPKLRNACDSIFDEKSTVIPQGLTKDAESTKMLNRSSHAGSLLATLDYSIISNHSIPSDDVDNEKLLKSKWWRFIPNCYLFKQFDKNIRTRLENKGSFLTTNQALTAIFAPKSFQISEKDGSLVATNHINNVDPNLRVRAVYVGVSVGGRVSFPGMKFNKTDEVLYDPKDRPWFQLVHKNPKSHEVGSCDITPPYADIRSQLLVVRTIVCKGEIVSKHNAIREFALGVDLVINKNRETVNSELQGIARRLKRTADPYASLSFKRIEKYADVSQNSKVDEVGFSNALNLAFLDLARGTSSSIFSDSMMFSALFILIFSIIKTKSKSFLYARLLETIKYGEERVESSARGNDLFFGLARFFGFKFWSSTRVERIGVGDRQRSLRAKHTALVMIGKSATFNFLGFSVEIPYQFDWCQVIVCQNRKDEIAISKVVDSNISSANAEIKLIEGTDVIGILTEACSSERMAPVIVKCYSEEFGSPAIRLPSSITGFSILSKIEDRELSLKRKRVRIKTNYAELGALFSHQNQDKENHRAQGENASYIQSSVTVVNRLFDLSSALRRDKEGYFKLLEFSDNDVERFILCSSQRDLDRFIETFKDEYEAILTIHQRRGAQIRFLICPPVLGELGFDTAQDQFIFLESCVVVLEGIEEVTVRGLGEGKYTRLRGYVSWNYADLHYYNSFVQELRGYQKIATKQKADDLG